MVFEEPDKTDAALVAGLAAAVPDLVKVEVLVALVLVALG